MPYPPYQADHYYRAVVTLVDGTVKTVYVQARSAREAEYIAAATTIGMPDLDHIEVVELAYDPAIRWLGITDVFGPDVLDPPGDGGTA